MCSQHPASAGMPAAYCYASPSWWTSFLWDCKSMQTLSSISFLWSKSQEQKNNLYIACFCNIFKFTAPFYFSKYCHLAEVPHEDEKFFFFISLFIGEVIHRYQLSIIYTVSMQYFLDQSIIRNQFLSLCYWFQDINSSVIELMPSTKPWHCIFIYNNKSESLYVHFFF